MISLANVLLQWIIGELACYTYSMVVVPLYDTLGAEAIVFIINQGICSSQSTGVHLGPVVSSGVYWGQLESFSFQWFPGIASGVPSFPLESSGFQ